MLGGMLGQVMRGRFGPPPAREPAIWGHGIWGHYRKVETKHVTSESREAGDMGMLNTAGGSRVAWLSGRNRHQATSKCMVLFNAALL